MAKSNKKNTQDFHSALWQDFAQNSMYLGIPVSEAPKLVKTKTLLNSETEREYIHSGLWRGITGRLKFTNFIPKSTRFSGMYDWNGYAFSGYLWGMVTNVNTIFFRWQWEKSSEKGCGFFKYNKKSLCGGWWFDHEAVDVYRILNNEVAPPNKWEFYKSSVIDDKISSISIIREKVSVGNIEEALEGAMLFINIYYPEYNNDIRHLSSRFFIWKNDNVRGLQKNTYEVNNITYSLLELVKNIEKIFE